MTNIQGSNEERKAMMIRFIIVYAMCILFAIVPLYYLFHIQGKVLGTLNDHVPSDKGPIAFIQRYESIMIEMDSLVKEKKPGWNSKYKARVDLLFSMSDSVEKKNLYHPLFLKMPLFYDTLIKINTIGDKPIIDSLKRVIRENAEKFQDEIKTKDVTIQTLQGIINNK